jgi:hypothetical protein
MVAHIDVSKTLSNFCCALSSGLLPGVCGLNANIWNILSVPSSQASTSYLLAYED